MANIPLIAVVDDEDSVRAAVGSLVRSLGYDAQLFASAENYMAAEGMADTACLIVDVQMPNMSGLELQLHMKSIGRTTPFIFMTAFPEETIRQRALAGGALCILDKPFEGATLIHCIERALAQHLLTAPRVATQ